MSDAIEYQVVCGDSSHMDIIRNEEADLIVTSPPYFQDSLLGELKQPRRNQVNFAYVKNEIYDFAATLEPVFQEMHRVIRRRRAVVIQTKDIRYGDELIGLASVHREMMEKNGFRLNTRILWQRPHSPFDPAHRFRRFPRVGNYRAPDTEEILVFSLDGEIENQGELSGFSQSERDELRSPVWVISPAREKHAHPYGSPPELVRRLISLYSCPNDMVVDPFLGNGTTLRVALELGRRGVGYEIDTECFDASDVSILRKETQR